MGLCQSQDTSSRGRKRPTGKTKGGKGKHGGKGGRKPRRSPSRSSRSSHSDHSGSDSDDGKKNNYDDPAAEPDSPNQNKAMDTSEYLKQYPIISQEDQDLLFYKARTCTQWAKTAVPHELLRNAMKLALLAPSAYNCCPMRVVFVCKENTTLRDKLIECADPDSVRLIQDAPVCAIVCTDIFYTRNLPKLMPYVPNAQQMFEQYDDLNEMIRIRNSNLQAGYLILALRSLGLAVGATCGFQNELCDQHFLQNTNWKSNFIITTGYPAENATYPPRAYRLPFDVAAKLL